MRISHLILSFVVFAIVAMTSTILTADVYDLRPDRNKNLNQPLFHDGELYAIRINALTGTFDKLYEGKFYPGHIWIEWCLKGTSFTGDTAFIPQEIYGYYGNGETKCAVKCTGEIRKELDTFKQQNQSKHSSILVIITEKQYTAGLTFADKLRRESGKLDQEYPYGIITFTQNAISCRGFIKEVFGKMRIDLKIPGDDTPAEYLKAIAQTLEQYSR